ncbi:MAG: tRNA pseudouridine(38-40) synthase TruA [Firmicutes bacterium]|nr:tRNA pseudouridine(38-40) synthase TruA [Bacillota bacterium]
MRYKITISYDGSAFFGWQRQKDKPTVQGAVETALFKVYGQFFTVTGSGRTDEGVHAYGQVAHFDAPDTIAPDKMVNALNHFLPPSVRVLSCEVAPEGFHARKSAKRKTYYYDMYFSGVECPLLVGRALWLGKKGDGEWGMGNGDKDENLANSEKRIANSGGEDLHWQPVGVARPNPSDTFHSSPPYPIPHPPSPQRVQAAASLFIGRHDFNAFHCKGSSAQTTVRTIFECAIEPVTLYEKPALRLKIAADGFLYKMVRIIAGSLIRVGEGKLAPEDLAELLRTGADWPGKVPAEACGLYLYSVEYKNNDKL